MLRLVNKVFFWEETLLPSQDDIHLSRISYYASLSEQLLLSSEDPTFVWKEYQFLSLHMRVFVLHPKLNWSFLSRDWLCPFWRITFKSIPADKSLCSSEIWIFHWKESYAFIGFCWVFERINFPQTQYITRKRISFYLVLFFNIQSSLQEINLHIHNVRIKLSMNNNIDIHCIDNIHCLSTYLILCMLSK